MNNGEKVKKIEEMIIEMAKIRNEDIEKALKSFSNSLDEIYLHMKIMLEGIKELKEGEKNEFNN